MKKIAFALIGLSLLVGCAGTPPERSPFELHKFEQRFGYTHALRVGSRIWVSGTVAMDAQGNVVGKGDMRAQIAQVYANLSKALSHYGADWADVVKETVHTTDMDAFLKATDERAKVYKGRRFPVSSWIGVPRLVSPDYLVEVGLELELPARR